MILHTTEVTALSEHRLFLRFNNGDAGELDSSGALDGEVFEPLREPVAVCDRSSASRDADGGVGQRRRPGAGISARTDATAEGAGDLRHRHKRLHSKRGGSIYANCPLDYTYKYAYIHLVRYTYDAKKRAANLKKHGYDFNDAPQVIEGAATVTFEDRRFDYDEQRFITLGVLRGSVVVIATAETDEEIRVISMRRAERHEEKIYHSNL